jgi:hypothetical protein
LEDQRLERQSGFDAAKVKAGVERLYMIFVARHRWYASIRPAIYTFPSLRAKRSNLRTMQLNFFLASLSARISSQYFLLLTKVDLQMLPLERDMGRFYLSVVLLIYDVDQFRHPYRDLIETL